MGLFDIFKTKKQPPKENLSNENALEQSLRRAAGEPAFRTAFYEKLLSEKLIVLTNKTMLPDGAHTLEEDTNVNLHVMEDGRIPVFTSTDRIFDKGVIKERVPFLSFKGEDLFSFTTGATFILNPYSDYGKELLPHEIQSLLKGTILTDNHETIIVEKEAQVQIGQPANYPTEMVSSLKALFADRPAVKAAYLGWIFNPTSGQPPHLIFALDIEGEKQKITNDAGSTAQQFSKKGEIIDFIQIDENNGLSNYFLKDTKAFYTR